MNRNARINRFVTCLVFAAAATLAAFAVGCVGPDGVRTSPIVPTATFAADEGMTQVIADARSNGNTTVMRATMYGIAGFRDAYTGVWIMPPRMVSPNLTYVWRRDPKFEGTFGVDEPLPAWVETEHGLWRVGEAASLGYTFESADQ